MLPLKIKLKHMKKINYKNLLLIVSIALGLTSCGSDDKSEETTFYKKESVTQKKLELTIFKWYD